MWAALLKTWLCLGHVFLSKRVYWNKHSFLFYPVCPQQPEILCGWQMSCILIMYTHTRVSYQIIFFFTISKQTVELESWSEFFQSGWSQFERSQCCSLKPFSYMNSWHRPENSAIVQSLPFHACSIQQDSVLTTGNTLFDLGEEWRLGRA